MADKRRHETGGPKVRHSQRDNNHVAKIKMATSPNVMLSPKLKGHVAWKSRTHQLQCKNGGMNDLSLLMHDVVVGCSSTHNKLGLASASFIIIIIATIETQKKRRGKCTCCKTPPDHEPNDSALTTRCKGSWMAWHKRRQLGATNTKTMSTPTAKNGGMQNSGHSDAAHHELWSAHDITDGCQAVTDGEHEGVHQLCKRISQRMNFCVVQNPHAILALPRTVRWRPCCVECDRAVQNLRSTRELWATALTVTAKHGQMAERRAHSVADVVRNESGKLERSWERRRACFVVENIMSATDTNGILHMHHCQASAGEHGDEWQPHAHQHGKQLLRVLDEQNAARCCETEDKVNKRQATAQANVRRAREKVVPVKEHLHRLQTKQQDQRHERRRRRKDGTDEK